ncbi:hypothetical protein BUALT_Bualt06G0132900 [Buddleja alternifolia]|uniref:Myb/SANT-like domain-containing protein n=1 Tax=Buddleja alternifolia TaxID=168488 RepID=A0AAV6XF05_9LAMI|nr:hypothetical protein BUALT_Bualt06G0132900 [Buddleja alternifolia]
MYLDGLIYESDKTCYEELRMDRFTFRRLCCMLQATRRLKETRNMTIDEQVAMFLHILAHHLKNRTIKNHFLRSGETVSRYFNRVLKAVLQLQGELLKIPEPVPEHSTDPRWKWFKNCLGALDGTYIEVIVHEEDKPRWEGSAADGRILRDALSRRNSLKVPNDMEFDHTNGRHRGKGSKHVWTSDEDENLINSLIELKEKGIYNTEGGGFKHGVFKELERILQVKLPGHGLKENPYIQSRYKLLKRQYQHFYDLRAAGQGSGFGWDDNRKCLTASTDLWEEYMQEAPGDIIEDLDNEQEEENDDNIDTMASLDDIDSRFTQPSIIKRPDGESSKQGPQKRRKSADGLMSGLKDIAEMMGNRLKESREQMSNMINVIAAPEQQNMDNR